MGQEAARGKRMTTDEMLEHRWKQVTAFSEKDLDLAITLTQDLIDRENAVFDVLDRKAVVILASTGLIASILGTIVAQEIDCTVKGLMGAGIVFVAAAAALALWALKIDRYHEVTLEAVLHEERDLAARPGVLDYRQSVLHHLHQVAAAKRADVNGRTVYILAAQVVLGLAILFLIVATLAQLTT